MYISDNYVGNKWIKKKIRITANNLNKMLTPIIVLDQPSRSNYIQPKYNRW